MIGVYKITSPSGKIYIGSSIEIEKRKHIYKGAHCKGQKKIYNSLIKYGFNNHKFEIIEECSIEELYKREVYYGELFDVLGNNGLNLALPKVDDIKSVMSQEVYDALVIRNRAIAKTREGIPRSEETKRKLSISHTGKKMSEKHRIAFHEGTSKINAKLVIDLETGIFCDSIKQASIAKNIIHSTLKSRINGTSPTKTMIVYA